MLTNICTPLPDECLRGYAFRLFSLNRQPLKAIANLSLEVSTLTGIDLLELARLHCHTAYKRFVCNEHAFKNISHQGDLRTHRSVISATIPTAHAYYCSECTAEDIRCYGISYWKRIHHLTGVNHCVKHHSPLQTATLESMISSHPQSLAFSSTAIPIEDRREYFKYPAILRFGMLSSAILHTRISFQHSTMASVLLRRFQELYPNAALRFLGLACNSFPRPWLIHHFPEMFRRSDVIPEPVIASGQRRISNKHYLLALSLLWDDTDAALNACWFEHLSVQGTACNPLLRSP